jgi:serine protease Do
MKKFLYFLTILLATCPLFSSDKKDPRITPTVKAVTAVLPSVVNIGTERIVSSTYSPWGQNDPFEGVFKDFFAGQKGKKETSLGSGAIINREGLIVTNAHVVYKATKILVTTADGKQYLAQEIAGDNLNDIALLKLINYNGKSQLKPIKFASPDQLLLGETVIAVGNPYGLGSSISKGILSGWGRKVIYGSKVIFSDILQTDAPINPGNSGGPLVNINAEMIGLNTAIYEQAHGIGFAIPLKRVEKVLAAWLIPERFSDVSLGIIPGEKHENGKLKFYLKEVISQSPAWQAGLRSGDQIFTFNEKQITQLIDVSNVLWKLKSGNSISLGLKNNKSVTLHVKAIKILDGKKLAEQKLGIGIQHLTKKLAITLGYPFHGGMVVDNVSKKNRSIHRGDVIVKIGDVPIYDFKDIHRALAGKYYGDKIDALVIFLSTQHGQIQIYKRNISLNIQ